MTAQVDPLSIEARLRAIHSITDAALSQLDDRELLVEVLDRIREIMHVDTAAVLLLDSSAGQLIATAAVGLEDEVRQGVRIPVGQGSPGGSPPSTGRLFWTGSITPLCSTQSCWQTASGP